MAVYFHFHFPLEEWTSLFGPLSGLVPLIRKLQPSPSPFPQGHRSSGHSHTSRWTEGSRPTGSPQNMGASSTVTRVPTRPDFTSLCPDRIVTYRVSTCLQVPVGKTRVGHCLSSVRPLVWLRIRRRVDAGYSGVCRPWITGVGGSCGEDSTQESLFLRTFSGVPVSCPVDATFLWYRGRLLLGVRVGVRSRETRGEGRRVQTQLP